MRDVLPAETPVRRRGSRPGLLVGLVLLVIAVLAVCGLSLVIGARDLPWSVVIDALTRFDPTNTGHLIVEDVRVPRTVAGLLAGAALGVSGALMHGVTRNPLADPGILGINGGAAAGVVAAIGVFGISNATGYVWFGFLGAGTAGVLVYVTAAQGREGVTPIKLALSGAVITAALDSLTTLLLISDALTFDEFRFWQVGSLTGRDPSVAAQVLPFFAAGAVLALGSGRALNVLSLGEDVAGALGQRVGLVRVRSAVAVMLLCGCATAVAGPIAFVGLAVAHTARLITGPDYRWILPYAMLLAALLVLVADIVGRVIAPPGEVQVGVVTAVIGAPVFLLLIRRRRLMRI